MNATVSLTFTFTQDRIIRLIIASSAFGSIYALATQTSPLPYHGTGAAIIAVTAVAITVVRSLSRPPTPPGEGNVDIYIDDFVVHRLPDQRQGNRHQNNIPRREQNNNNNNRRNPPINNNITRPPICAAIPAAAKILFTNGPNIVD